MAKTPIFIVDAFVGVLGERVFRGNPAAVALLDGPRDAAWMQAVAGEMNLSETAFLVQSDALNFELRWFTPQCEVEICGHATLAGAHILWEDGQVAPHQAIRFHTLSGVLGAKSESEWIWLDFPAQLPKPIAPPPDLALALGFSAREPVAFFQAGDDYLASVPRGYVETLSPDFAWLRQISLQLKVRGLIVTAPASPDSPCDFVSRFFAPAIGLNEDPVTGSAHAALAPFWGEKLGKLEMKGLQASARGGLIQVKWRGGRALIAGRARTSVRGQLLI